ncbi:MAG TPA: LuxR C-terminal-related transcriptional regulator [Caulobacteraceae bacterium]|jgi:DNA-binding CsgD family transcriptional regulator
MDRAAAALGLISDLTSAPTVSRAVDLFESAVEPFGVELYRTAALANVLRGPLESATVSNWSADWETYYMGVKAFTFDPIVDEVLKGGDAFFWHDLNWTPTPVRRHFMADAAEVGHVDGFMAVRQAPGELKTVVSMASSRPLAWSPMEQGVVSFVANAMISRVLYLREVQLAPDVTALSDREKDILRHAALGQPDKRIALALDCAHDTVRAHWRSIRRKLTANDRAHAVAVAIWSGQIAP